MDGPASTRQNGHQDGHQRGGRGGGISRKASGTMQVYRRVDAEKPAVEEAKGAEPPAPAFKSSLLASIAKSPPRKGNELDEKRDHQGPTKSPVKRGNGRGGRGDRSRSRSPKRTPQTADIGRRVEVTSRRDRSGSIESNASTSSSRWVRKVTDESARPALGRSVSGQDARFSDTRQSRSSSSSSQRGGLRYQDEDSSSYRHVELSRDNGSHRPFKSSLTRGRRDSFESDTSEVSVRSTTSNRSTRSTRSNVSSRYGGRGDYGSRRSIDDGRRGDRASLTSRYEDDRQGPPSRRFERSVSDFSGSDAYPPPAPATSLRGSTLGGSRTVQDARVPNKPAAASVGSTKSAQDTRVASSGQSPGFQSSLTSSLRASAAQNVEKKEAPAPAFKSSLTASIKSEQRQAPTEEAPPKRLVDRLREQQGEFRSGISLGDRSVSLSQSDRSSHGARPGQGVRDSRPGSGSSILSRVGERQTSVNDKESRTRDHFAQLDAADKKREAARRAAEPFQSSLLSSLARPYTPKTRQILNKLTYTVLELRNLKPNAASTPCPSDLKSMKLGEVIEIRPRVGVVPGSTLRASTRRPKPSARGGSTRSVGANGRAPGGRERPPSKKDSQRSGGGRRGAPPPPPLYDGPIEPLQVSENRWVPKKAAASGAEATLSHVKSVLNKLTREKFAKLTDELCSTEITSLSMLASIIKIIMEKAIEEPSFADVYADLCKEFHARTMTTVWGFLRAVRAIDKANTYLWTAIQLDESSDFHGPFPSEQACVEAAESNTETATCTQDMHKAYMIKTSTHLLTIVEAAKGSFYFKKKAIDSLTQDEPLLGEWASADEAIKAARRLTSFKKLLVTGCQDEFERPTQSGKTTEAENGELDQRQKDVLATRAKRRMIGNIRFIGELFKADFLHQLVVQSCVLHLLGVDLVEQPGSQLAGQEVRLPDDEELEALCKLLATVGKKFDQPEREQVMRIIILRVVELSDDKRLPSRTRFLLKDILEMRDHLWEPRRKELQQKTLEEVRREAMLLQQQGKNAQHDNVSKRRLKSQVSSAQLAKESSKLLVRKDTASETSAMEPTSPTSISQVVDEDPAKVQTRIKSIIQEYSSIHDIEEASVCVRELSPPSVLLFAEECVNRSLEGSSLERADAVDLVVKLYARGVIDATTIQMALVSVFEFLEDMKIDIPLVHQCAALLLGRLIAVGCFGLSWMISKALKDLVESGLTSLVFAETLQTIAADTDARTVARMVAAEELHAASVLPRLQRDDSMVKNFIEKNRLEVYFGGESPQDDVEDDDEDDELDPEVESKMRSTLDEYLSVKDLDEVVLCVKEFVDADTPAAYYWRHFMRVCIVVALDSKASSRLEVAKLIQRLLVEKADDTHIEDVEWGFESALVDYEDVRVDVPKVADSYADLWASLFEMGDGLTLQWLLDACVHLIATGYAAEILGALLTKFDALFGRDKLLEWCKRQPESPWLESFSADAKTEAVHESLATWQQILASP